MSCGLYLLDVQHQIAIAGWSGLKLTPPHFPLNLITIVRLVVPFTKKPVLCYFQVNHPINRIFRRHILYDLNG